MADTIVTTGIPDSQLYLQAAANVAAPWDVTPNEGAFPLVGNVLAQRRLANQWLMINLSNRAFVDGMGVTSVGAESENVGFLQFPLLYLPPRIKRTLGTDYNGTGAAGGTSGNGEPFNKNLPHGVQTDGYLMKFVQEYDEATQISRVNMRMIGNNLDLLGKYTSYIPIAVGMLQDADVMATHIGAGLARAAESNNANIVVYNPTDTTDGYMQRIMNTLRSKLSNIRGAYKEGVVSYPREKSVFVLRQSVFDNLMTIKNGALVNSDIAQKILLNGYLDESGERLLGNYIEGKYAGIYIKVIPDEYWDTAAAELNLTVEQYAQFNKVVGYIANAEGTLFGMSSTVTDIDKSPTTSIGFIIRNDWGWGVKCVRPSSIALLVESDDNLATFVNPVPTFTDIVSPANIEAFIDAYQGGSVSEMAVQRIGVSTPNLVTDVTITVAPNTLTAADNLEVVVRKADGTYASVSSNVTASGTANTFTFTLDRASEATVAVSADGYVSQVVAITAANTATATYAATVTLATSKG